MRFRTKSPEKCRKKKRNENGIDLDIENKNWTT